MAARKRRSQGARNTVDSLSLSRACAVSAADKLADEIVVLDLRGLTYVTDFFVIVTGRNARQVGAIAAAVKENMDKAGQRPIGIQGAEASGWVLLDYADVVVHVFSREARKLYDLELLWGDAPRVEFRPGRQATTNDE